MKETIAAFAFIGLIAWGYMAANPVLPPKPDPYCENMATENAIFNNKPIDFQKIAAACMPAPGPSLGL